MSIGIPIGFTLGTMLFISARLIMSGYWPESVYVAFLIGISVGSWISFGLAKWDARRSRA